MPMHRYLAVLWRNLRREKLYAAINIAGLSLGLACSLVLGQFLRKELSYDQHYPQYPAYLPRGKRVYIRGQLGALGGYVADAGAHAAGTVSGG